MVPSITSEPYSIEISLELPSLAMVIFATPGRATELGLGRAEGRTAPPAGSRGERRSETKAPGVRGVAGVRLTRTRPVDSVLGSIINLQK